MGMATPCILQPQTQHPDVGGVHLDDLSMRYRIRLPGGFKRL